MKEQEYRNAVAKLANPKLTFNERLGNWAAGICGESAEVDIAVEFGDKLKVKDELSDCRWYLTAFCVDLDLPLAFISPEFAIYYDNADQQSRMLLRVAGNIADIIKKVIYHGHPLTKHVHELINLLSEYVSTYVGLADLMELTDDEITTYNFQKLSARYKDLNFTTSQSVNRNNELQING